MNNYRTLTLILFAWLVPVLFIMGFQYYEGNTTFWGLSRKMFPIGFPEAIYWGGFALFIGVVENLNPLTILIIFAMVVATLVWMFFLLTSKVRRRLSKQDKSFNSIDQPNDPPLDRSIKLMLRTAYAATLFLAFLFILTLYIFINDYPNKLGSAHALKEKNMYDNFKISSHDEKKGLLGLKQIFEFRKQKTKEGWLIRCSGELCAAYVGNNERLLFNTSDLKLNTASFIQASDTSNK